MSDKLNPCGCGGVFEVFQNGKGADRVYQATCNKCTMSTPVFKTLDELRAMVNTAHPLAIRLDDIREMKNYCVGGNCGNCKFDKLCDIMYHTGSPDSINLRSLEQYIRERSEG
jgi:hypothetical protein